MTWPKCIICGHVRDRLWYTLAICFGAKDDIDVGPWCDDCKPSARTAASRVRYALMKMAEKRGEARK